MKLIITVFLFTLAIAMNSCVNTRPIQYVQGTFDTAQLSRYVTKDQVIRKADMLSIIVYSDNPLATEVYNIPNTGGNAGYLVDENGNIQFQGLGNVKVEGLTKSGLTALLSTKLSPVLQNPFFAIRFLNFKVTVLGEVSREGQFNISSEKVNLLEAIGLAGGLSIYARRDNVLIIRETNGKREFGRLNLTDPAIFNSPYYFLQQNDMVIIEQSRNKVANNDQTVSRNVSLVSTIISTILVLYSVFIR